jgi:type III restriction enzyme
MARSAEPRTAGPAPIQPVETPILCSPYSEPTEHWVFDEVTGEASKLQGRREACYWFRTEEAKGVEYQGRLFAEENRVPLEIVNRLRHDVRRWRESGYEGATQVTKQLLAEWKRADRIRRLFFCQLEAVETVIYLAEIRLAGRRTRFSPQTTDANLARLVDDPSTPGMPSLRRLGCKMATGSGKTVVMAMVAAWTLCNRGRTPSDDRFPAAILIVCPNLTVKERLQVLRPDVAGNYYDTFGIVPSKLRPHMRADRVVVTNWHAFAPESPHSDGGKNFAVVDKGEEGPEAFTRRILKELGGLGQILVLNDEGHHCYRPKPPAEPLIGEEAKAAKEDREEATVWISGLDRINQGSGIRFCVDLSATPFFLVGSGHPEGSPFPWLVSDFGLVDAIESGITKIPRLPVSDTTGRPDPKYFRLWDHIVDRLKPGERLAGRAGKPKPEVVYREAEPALNTLASQWVERFNLIEAASDAADKSPPVIIIVCDNVNIAEVFYRNISGETLEEAATVLDEPDEDSDDPDDEPVRKREKKAKRGIVYGPGKIFPEHFANTPEFPRRTVRIDSKLLEQAESSDPNAKAKEAAEELRRIVATVGRRGEPGEQVRCVVSVSMLTEGWDANNVTHILGLRAFRSQLLCEQVVGRGLRRMNYTPDPATGLLTAEYADVYGIPFSIIPFKGREKGKPAPEDGPNNYVHALAERAAFEIRYPVVEGFAFDLHRDAITADVAAMERLSIEPEHEPTAVFVQPQVGYRVGPPSASGPGEFVEQDRAEYYLSRHFQTIQFEIARLIVNALTEGDPRGNPKLRLQARHRLFPQVLRYVLAYVENKVDFRGVNKCELGLEKYVQRIVERLLTAIEPDEDQGETPLLPILNRYEPMGSTADVKFFTVRRCFGTQKSHINFVVLDTETWEQSAAFRLEQSDRVAFYARNDQLGLVIPYEYDGAPRVYMPDFLVRLTDGRTLVLETKGYLTDEDKAKHAAAKRWVSAVNHWGQLGTWSFLLCVDPQDLINQIGLL